MVWPHMVSTCRDRIRTASSRTAPIREAPTREKGMPVARTPMARGSAVALMAVTFRRTCRRAFRLLPMGKDGRVVLPAPGF